MSESNREEREATRKAFGLGDHDKKWIDSIKGMLHPDVKVMRTAVEEFIEDLEKDGVRIGIDVHYYIEKEKQQIMDAFNVEIYAGEDDNDRDAEQYYKELTDDK